MVASAIPRALPPEGGRGSTGFTAFSDCSTHKPSHQLLTSPEVHTKWRKIECAFSYTFYYGALRERLVSRDHGHPPLPETTDCAAHYHGRLGEGWLEKVVK